MKRMHWNKRDGLHYIDIASEDFYPYCAVCGVPKWAIEADLA